MSLTTLDDRAFIQGQIDTIVQEQNSRTELSVALNLLTPESQERVASILSLRGDDAKLIDLQELLLPA